MHLKEMRQTVMTYVIHGMNVISILILYDIKLRQFVLDKSRIKLRVSTNINC